MKQQGTRISSEEAKKMQARLRATQSTRGLMAAPVRQSIHATTNPRPQQTTQFRIDKVARDTLVVRDVASQEIALRTWRNSTRDRYTSSEYWRDGYSVPTTKGRSQA